MRIGSIAIGLGHPTFIIAEAGVNHDGCLETAIRLVDAAKAAGANAVKFQTFSARDLVTSGAPKAEYQIENTGVGDSQLQMLEKLELSDNAFHQLAAYCQQRDMLFLSTPYGSRDIRLLGECGVSAIKVASALAVEPRFLEESAALGVPLIISTGMMTMEEVSFAARTLHHIAPGRFVLLQCVTNYPATVASSNLRAMQAMSVAFDCPIGFSDHTETAAAGSVAVAMGACVLERHLTLDRNAEGPDHRASSDPEGFARYVETIREAESALGDGVKQPAPEEQRNASKMRRSLVASRNLAAGHRIAESDLLCKRPGTGIAPKEQDAVLGRQLRVSVVRDQVLQWEMFE